MKSLTPKLLGIALLFALSFTYAFPWNAVGITPPFAQSNYKLGLDLNG
jgi:hypothetical protein